MVRMDCYTKTLPQEAGIPSGAADSSHAAAGGTASNMDTVTISEEARRASIASQLEQVAGFSPETAEKLASGAVTITEPDWGSYKIPSLQVNLPPMFYEKVRGETMSREFETLETQVQAYYAPMLSEMDGMDTNEAMWHLFQTYKLPWLENASLVGTPVPKPPEGMSQQEADMAYQQLESLFLVGRPAVVRDPYALGEEGLARFDRVGTLAEETAQAACDAARAELDQQQEEAKTQWKEQLQQNIQTINASGAGLCLGFLSLCGNGPSDKA